MFKTWAAFALLLPLAGCGGYYRYERLAHADLVTPPHSKLPGTRCLIETDTLSLRGRSVIYKGPDPDAPGRIPMSVLRDFQRVRAELSRCLPEPKAAAMLQLMPLRVPMASNLAAQLVYGGELDLRPPLTLLYLAPNTDGTGVITSRYRARPDGRLVRMTGPETPLDAFVSRHRVFRLLYLTRGADANHDEMLLGAGSRDELRDANADCRGSYGCFPLTRGTGLRPEFAVTLDGATKYVPHFSTVRDVTARPIRSITRGASKRPVRSKDPISGMALLGGEVIRTAK